jgi:3-hydroxy acid dehydrogenase/malonic semialdehyde reductase
MTAPDSAGSGGIGVTEIMPELVRSGFPEQRLGDARQAQQFNAGIDAYLDPDDVARTVLIALQQPARLEIALLVVLPVAAR